MKSKDGRISYRGKEYRLVFNMNVMESIQDEYGTLDNWGKLTDAEGEPNIKAVKFGIREMLNEGIEIANEENGTKDELLSLKQVGRMLTEIGIAEAATKMNDTVVESTKSEGNA